MFDIGFLELCLIGIIALLVIGPEKLPRVARTVGLWMGKVRGAIKTVKYDIDEQVRMEELKESMRKAAANVETGVAESITRAEDSIQELQEDITNNEPHSQEK